MHAAFILILTLSLALSAPPCGAQSPDSIANDPRLASCDPAVIHSAAQEILRDPKTLEEPLVLFHAALGERMTGRKEEAAFLYLAARLRSSRQSLFEKGERPQLMTIMVSTIGPLVMPAIGSDPEMAARVVSRVIAWDRATPDPFRDRKEAKSPEIQKRLADIDARLSRLPEQFRDPALAARAQVKSDEADRHVKEMFEKRCGKRQP